MKLFNLSALKDITARSINLCIHVNPFEGFRHQFTSLCGLYTILFTVHGQNHNENKYCFSIELVRDGVSLDSVQSQGKTFTFLKDALNVCMHDWNHRAEELAAKYDAFMAEEEQPVTEQTVNEPRSNRGELVITELPIDGKPHFQGLCTDSKPIAIKKGQRLFTALEAYLVEKGIAHNVTNIEPLRYCGKSVDYTVTYNKPVKPEPTKQPEQAATKEIMSWLADVFSNMSNFNLLAMVGFLKGKDKQFNGTLTNDIRNTMTSNNWMDGDQYDFIAMKAAFDNHNDKPVNNNDQRITSTNKIDNTMNSNDNSNNSKSDNCKTTKQPVQPSDIKAGTVIRKIKTGDTYTVKSDSNGLLFIDSCRCEGGIVPLNDSATIQKYIDTGLFELVEQPLPVEFMTTEQVTELNDQLPVNKDDKLNALINEHGYCKLEASRFIARLPEQAATVQMFPIEKIKNMSLLEICKSLDDKGRLWNHFQPAIDSHDLQLVFRLEDGKYKALINWTNQGEHVFERKIIGENNFTELFKAVLATIERWNKSDKASEYLQPQQADSGLFVLTDEHDSTEYNGYRVRFINSDGDKQSGTVIDTRISGVELRVTVDEMNNLPFNIKVKNIISCKQPEPTEQPATHKLHAQDLEEGTILYTANGDFHVSQTDSELTDLKPAYKNQDAEQWNTNELIKSIIDGDTKIKLLVSRFGNVCTSTMKKGEQYQVIVENNRTHEELADQMHSLESASELTKMDQSVLMLVSDTLQPEPTKESTSDENNITSVGDANKLDHETVLLDESKQTDDIYSGGAWRVQFDDGFHNTDQVIIGDSESEAIATFEKQTGFKVFRSIQIQAKVTEADFVNGAKFRDFSATYTITGRDGDSVSVITEWGRKEKHLISEELERIHDGRDRFYPAKPINPDLLNRLEWCKKAVKNGANWHKVIKCLSLGVESLGFQCHIAKEQSLLTKLKESNQQDPLMQDNAAVVYCGDVLGILFLSGSHAMLEVLRGNQITVRNDDIISHPKREDLRAATLEDFKAFKIHPSGHYIIDQPTEKK